MHELVEFLNFYGVNSSLDLATEYNNVVAWFILFVKSCDKLVFLNTERENEEKLVKHLRLPNLGKDEVSLYPRAIRLFFLAAK